MEILYFLWLFVTNLLNELVRLLLQYKANVNKQDKYGWTALHYCLVGTNEMVELLLDYRADVNAISKKGVTPLMIACEKSSRGNALLLARAGADFCAGSKSA